MPQGPESPPLAGDIVVALTQPALDKGFNRPPARYSDHVLQVLSLAFGLLSCPVPSCPVPRGYARGPPSASRSAVNRLDPGTCLCWLLADAGAVWLFDGASFAALSNDQLSIPGAAQTLALTCAPRGCHCPEKEVPEFPHIAAVCWLPSPTRTGETMAFCRRLESS